jgi:D-tyrosyl-tRNA(Tyr) deacylase
MKAVIQRVVSASVELDGRVVASIGRGLLALIGVCVNDGDADRAWMADKIAHLRIFEDDAGRMNLSVAQVGGSILAVPNFTVAGDARHGRRPSFDGALAPAEAKPVFDALTASMASGGIPVKAGVFGANTRVTLVNDGPVTILLDSRG